MNSPSSMFWRKMFCPKNESARTRLESSDARLNSPPPKSAQGLLYVELPTSGMARTGDYHRTLR
jgi:hypothetical protein